MMERNPHPATSLDLGQPESTQAGMDLFLGYFLLAGVVLSVALILIGLTWNVAITGQLWMDYRLEGMNLFQLLAAEIKQAINGTTQPQFFMNTGIALLMLTPFVRVLASVVYFIVGLKNWKYVVITSVVLGILTFSLFIR